MSDYSQELGKKGRDFGSCQQYAIAWRFPLCEMFWQRFIRIDKRTVILSCNMDLMEQI